MCDAMRWNHLPVAGGLYDQNPDLLDMFRLIFQARSEKMERDQKKQERQSKINSRSPRVAGKRGR